MTTEEMTMLGYAEVTLLVQLPGRERISIPMTIGTELAKCMRPLPRNREIEWEVGAILAATEQRNERDEAVKYISKTITNALLSAVESGDTKNGYSP